MLLHALGVFSVVIFGFCGAQKITLSSCKRNSSDYSVCLKRAIHESWPAFMAGLPEYNFPALDPFFFEYHRHVYNGLVIHASIVVANTTITGVGKARLISVNPYFNKDIFHLQGDMWIPEMFCEGDREIEGNLIGLKLNSKGHYNITMEDIRTRWFITGHVVNDRWNVKQVFIHPTIETMKIHLDDIENTRELNELAENFVNDNWPTLYHTMIPVASKVWDTLLTDYWNRFFSKVSFSKLFP